MNSLHSIILLAFMGTCSVSMRAQSSINYTYDAAGNRILREQAYYRGGLSRDSLSARDNRLGSIIISVAPNPTNGPITVTLTGLQESDVCTLTIYDSLGKILLSTTTTNETTSLDISSQPTGYYFLSATVREEKLSYKIIKE